MAKKDAAETTPAVNKSDAIREHFTQNPKATPKEIIATLGERGIKVAPSLIYFVKSRMVKSQRKATREKAAESLSNSGLANPLDLVIRVKQLANEVGGLKNLKKLVDALAE